MVAVTKQISMNVPPGEIWETLSKFDPFYPLEDTKIIIFTKKLKMDGDFVFTPAYQKSYSYVVWLLRYGW